MADADDRLLDDLRSRGVDPVVAVPWRTSGYRVLRPRTPAQRRAVMLMWLLVSGAGVLVLVTRDLSGAGGALVVSALLQLTGAGASVVRPPIGGVPADPDAQSARWAVAVTSAMSPLRETRRRWLVVDADGVLRIAAEQESWSAHGAHYAFELTGPPDCPVARIDEVRSRRPGGRVRLTFADASTCVVRLPRRQVRRLVGAWRDRSAA